MPTKVRMKPAVAMKMNTITMLMSLFMIETKTMKHLTRMMIVIMRLTASSIMITRKRMSRMRW